MMKIKRLVPSLLVLCLALVALAHDGTRGMAEATINGKKLAVDYGRPALKGRDLMELAKVGIEWRLGMDAATTLDSTADLVVGGKELKAGKYILKVKRAAADSWLLTFRPAGGATGEPVAETPLKLEKASSPSEQLTITLSDKQGAAGIDIHWGTWLLTGSFGVK